MPAEYLCNLNSKEIIEFVLPYNTTTISHNFNNLFTIACINTYFTSSFPSYKDTICNNVMK